MLPSSHNANNSKYYQQSISYMELIRHKTRSNLQPNNQYQHNTRPYHNHNISSTKQSFIQQNSPQIITHNNSHNNSFINQPSIPSTANNYSDRYKSYYTQQSNHHYGDDKSKEKYQNNTYVKPNYMKYSEHNTNVYGSMINNMHNQSTTSTSPNNYQNNLSNAIPKISQEKSLQRKRFLTTLGSKSPDHSSSSSLSTIINTKQPPYNNTKQPPYNNTKQPPYNNSKQPYQFTAHKLSLSKVQNNNNKNAQNNYQQKSRQKRFLTDTSNKKISLKRDIISPRYQQFEKHKKLSLIEQRTKTDLLPKQQHHVYSQQNLQQKDSFVDNSDFKKRPYYYQGGSELMKMKKLSLKEQQQQDIEPNDKKDALKQRKFNNVNLVQSQVNQFQSQKGQKENKISKVYQNNVTKQNITDKINKSQSPSSQSHKPKPHNNNLFIDNDIYQDMKISRIQQSTLSLQQKYQQIQKVLQSLIKTQKQHQSQIYLLKSKLSQNAITLLNNRQQQSILNTNRTTSTRTQHNQPTTDYNHDLKRIKKQLKIIKNNFQLAFTSMTEQINRKLTKQQQIMKNLSQQIKLVATQNIKLSQSIEQKSSKVQQLQKSMTSFMQQNQQRIQNLVLLNDSFSSSANKRNRNNHSSFQYGLQLKNMSGEDGWMSAREKQALEGLKGKVEMLEREMKKMKVYHMEQKQVASNKLNEMKSMMNNLFKQVEDIKSKQQLLLSQQPTNPLLNFITKQLRQNITLQIEPSLQQINRRLTSQEQSLAQQISMIKQSLKQTRRSFNEQLYEFRLNKLYPTSNVPTNNNNNRFVIDNHNSSRQQQLMIMREKINVIQQKLQTINDKRLFTVQQKLSIIGRSIQQQKLKQLKHSGDIRQLQSNHKQFTHKLNQHNQHINQHQQNINQYKLSLTNIQSSAQSLRQSLKQYISNTNTQIQQINRVNQIQTQNIQSINNQFQRVINKQIIPKFQQIHINIVQTQRKYNLLRISIKDNNTEKNNIGNTNMNEVILRDKIQQYVNENINKFINNKVKLFTSKLISNKSPLTKLGILNNNNTNNIYNNNRFINNNNNSLSSSIVTDNSQVDKQNTYLIDQEGYLMDWQGTYLIEINNIDNKRTKIKLTQSQIYFMQVNGLNVIPIQSHQLQLHK